MKTITSALGVILLAAVAACGYSTSTPYEQPFVTLSTAVSSLSITQGDRASLDIAIERIGGFSAGVGLELAGAPNDAVVDLPTEPVAGDTASLTIHVGDATPAGVYPLTLKATANGLPIAKLALQLLVNQRTPVDVVVRYCAGLEPNWVAFQDGDGAWTRVFPATTGGTVAFNHTFLTNRGAMAGVVNFTSQNLAISVTSVHYAAPAELSAVGDTNPIDCVPGASKTLLGSVTGMGDDDLGVITTGFGNRAQVNNERTTFALRGLPGGPADLLATRFTTANGADLLTRMIVRRGIVFADSATLPVLDFAAAESFAPAVGNVSVTGPGAAGGGGLVELQTSHANLQISGLKAQPAGGIRSYAALPEAQLLPGEIQSLFVASIPFVPGKSQSARLYFRAPADRTIALGAPLAEPAFTTVATTPALRLRAQFVSQSDYEQLTIVGYQEGRTQVNVQMTAAYASLTGKGYALTVPDLSGAAGFDPSWALRPGEELFWNATRNGGTLFPSRDAVPTDGSTRITASSQGTITP